MGKRRIHPKWYICCAFALVGLAALLFLPGYDTTGCAFLGLSALIPIYHGLGLLKRRRPKLGRLGTIMLSGFLAVLLTAMALTCGVIVHSSRGTPDPQADYLVVLGAAVHGTAPSRSLNERLESARRYLTGHPDAVAIVSGGQGSGEDITEAECMYNVLTAAGIDPSRVWMEDRASNTLENLQFSLELIEAKTGARPDKIAIVSSEYHLHRAGMFARWLDIDAELVPAKTAIVPLRWNYYVREIFALWYYSLLGGTA